jgi:IclR family pca regulon transcriptional regulator
MGVKHIKSLEKGFAILQAFSPSCPTLTLQDLTTKTKLPKATVFRIVRTLISLDYITYDPKSKHYFLSPRVMLLGFTALSRMDLIDIAHPHLKQLSESIDQNVNLGILDGTDVVCIDRITRRQIINIDFHVGSTVKAHRTAIGRSLLAFLSEKEFQNTMNEILKDPEAAIHVGSKGGVLIQQLRKVRQEGYALNDEESVKGLRAIGAPIFTNGGRVEAAINIPVFVHDVSREELIERYVPLLLNTAEKISVARGFLTHALEKGTVP